MLTTVTFGNEEANAIIDMIDTMCDRAKSFSVDDFKQMVAIRAVGMNFNRTAIDYDKMEKFVDEKFGSLYFLFEHSLFRNGTMDSLISLRGILIYLIERGDSGDNIQISIDPPTARGLTELSRLFNV